MSQCKRKSYGCEAGHTVSLLNREKQILKKKNSVKFCTLQSNQNNFAISGT